MNLPVWLKPALLGACAGGVALAVVGFSWGGWMTGSKADLLASQRAQAEVTAALTPVCVANSAADPDRAGKMAKIKEAANYRRTEIVMSTGWATMPGQESPDRSIAAACGDQLLTGL